MAEIAPTTCPDCGQLRDQDALTVKAVEILGTFYNPCAPVNQFTCRCRTCGQRWIATEVYDDTGDAASVWTWERDAEPAPPA